VLSVPAFSLCRIHQALPRRRGAGGGRTTSWAWASLVPLMIVPRLVKRLTIAHRSMGRQSSKKMPVDPESTKSPPSDIATDWQSVTIGMCYDAEPLVPFISGSVALILGCPC